VLDNSDVPLTPTAQADVREPISSSCIATPFNKDGAACQGGSIGTPFFLFTDGTNPRGLFADAYQPGAPITGGAAAVGTSSANIIGSDNAEGAAVMASFQFGTTTAYGQTTAPQTIAPTNAGTLFSAQLSGLPAATTIHYRAVVTSDFGTFAGADRTLLTASNTPPPPPPRQSGHAKAGHARVSGRSASVRVSCSGSPGATCKLALKLTVHETLRGHRLLAVTARGQHKAVHRLVTVGSARVTLTAGHAALVKVGEPHGPQPARAPSLAEDDAPRHPDTGQPARRQRFHADGRVQGGSPATRPLKKGPARFG
jgi:hypothetical protein